jgi:asparagine synthase (glutamine-hydrolysing)
MSRIFGWLDPAIEPRATAGLIAKMGDAGAPERARATTFLALPGAAIGLRGGVLPADLAQTQTCLAAVQGPVRWHDAAIGREAAERGAAAAILAAYARDGEDVLPQLGGAFALALVDTARRLVLLAVDRIGIRTMCFAATPGGIAFGTSVDQVAAHPAVAAEVSRQAVFDYLYCHAVPSPETILTGVEKLLPAERVLFADGRAARRFYWQLRYLPDERTGEAGQAEEFRGLLRAGVARAIDGADPAAVGAFLSGGTDSSTVAGLLGEASGRPAETYSIGFAAEGFDEMSYARIAAKHFGANAHEHYVTPREVADAIPLVARAYDEPFGNASAVPTYCCAKLARGDGRSILLAGDGGDEVFGGNARYAKQKLFEWYGALPAPLRHWLVEPLALRLPGAARIPPLRKLASYVRQANVPLPDRLESYNLLEREMLEAVFEPEFLRAVDRTRPAQLAREVYFRTGSRSPVDRMMHLDLKQTLADNDLRKVNRMCELAGVEVRYPLLDDALVEFSGRLSPAQKVRRLELRHFFKRALAGFLPPETIAKEKHGFGLPFGVWMRTDPDLGALARDGLERFARRGWMRAAFVGRLLDAHRDVHATYFGTTIWVTVMLEHWLAARGR